jgi:hypothetical protein
MACVNGCHFRKQRKAGRIAKMMVYVEHGEAGIKEIAKTYRAEAFSRGAASGINRKK